MKRFTSYGLSLAAMMMSFFIVCSAAFAQDIPLVPKNYSASVSGTTIYAMWQKNPEGPEATGYKVYIAKGQTEDLSKFDLVATVTKPMDGDKYKYAIEKLSPGTYTVIVRAFNGNGEGNRTSIKVLTVKESSEGKGLVFKSTPKKEAGENSEYVYEAVVKYEKDPNAKILFRLGCDAPEGLELNPETGRIFWRTGAAGVYKICLEAYLESNNEVVAKQYFEVKVGSSSEGKGLVFKSTPKKEAGENSEYVYEAVVKYEKDPNAKILFRLGCDAPEGLELNPETGRIFWRTGAAGVYKICLEAYLESNNEVVAKQYFEVKVGGSTEEDGLVFTTEPKTKPVLGKEWVYEALAKYKKDPSVKVIYSLRNAPDGMVIDENTGRVTWTPSKTGVYEFSIIAIVVIDGKEIVKKQEFRYVIGDDDGKEEDVPVCSILFGKVAFENGEKAKAGMVTIVRLEGSGKGKYIAKVTNGAFEIKVPEGVYALMVSGETIVTEYYNNAESIEKAERLTIGCDEEKEVTFTVSAKAVAKKKIISGTVTNSEGKGVWCYIDVIDRKVVGENGKEIRYSGKSGEKGAYEISVPEGTEVIVQARAVQSDDYLPTFGESTLSAADAAVYTMNDNVKANIVLINRPAYKNSVNGVVREFNATTTRIASKVTLMNVKENGDKGRFRTIESDDQGTFSFSNIEPGTYIVQALPFDKAYRPGYYSANGEAVSEWKDAERITVTEESTATLEIDLGKAQGKKGIARLGGSVRKEKSNTKGDNVLADEMLSGALVVATDAFGNITDWTISDANGSYVLNQLAQGTYIVRVDRIDFAPTQVTVQTDYATRSNVRTDITVNSIASSIDEEATNAFAAYIYPNPVHNNASLYLGNMTNQGDVQISIINSLGVVVNSFTSVVSAANTIPLSLESLTSGVYYVRLVHGNEMVTLPCTVTK